MSTSKLQQKTTSKMIQHFGQFKIRENYRPDWLDGLELDIYIDALSTAVEVQGIQHLEYNRYFHRTDQAFRRQQQRDKDKATICERADIKLFYIYQESDIASVIQAVYARYDPSRTTIGTGWMSDEKELPPMSSQKDRGFQKKIALLGFAMKSNALEVQSIARELNDYAQRRNLTLTKRQRYRIDSALCRLIPSS